MWRAGSAVVADGAQSQARLKGDTKDTKVTKGAAAPVSRFASRPDVRRRRGLESQLRADFAAGGRDNGPPRHRRATCYNGFVFDPDNNNIEAISQTERVAAAAP
jgi:hypothetical protein